MLLSVPMLCRCRHARRENTPLLLPCFMTRRTGFDVRGRGDKRKKTRGRRQEGKEGHTGRGGMQSRVTFSEIFCVYVSDRRPVVASCPVATCASVACGCSTAWRVRREGGGGVMCLPPCTVEEAVPGSRKGKEQGVEREQGIVEGRGDRKA